MPDESSGRLDLARSSAENSQIHPTPEPKVEIESREYLELSYSADPSQDGDRSLEQQSVRKPAQLGRTRSAQRSQRKPNARPRPVAADGTRYPIQPIFERHSDSILTRAQRTASASFPERRTMPRSEEKPSVRSRADARRHRARPLGTFSDDPARRHAPSRGHCLRPR